VYFFGAKIDSMEENIGERTSRKWMTARVVRHRFASDGKHGNRKNRLARNEINNMITATIMILYDVPILHSAATNEYNMSDSRGQTLLARH